MLTKVIILVFLASLLGGCVQGFTRSYPPPKKAVLANQRPIEPTLIPIPITTSAPIPISIPITTPTYEPKPKYQPRYKKAEITLGDVEIENPN